MGGTDISKQKDISLSGKRKGRVPRGWHRVPSSGRVSGGGSSSSTGRGSRGRTFTGPAAAASAATTAVAAALSLSLALSFVRLATEFSLLSDTGPCWDIYKNFRVFVGGK